MNAGWSGLFWFVAVIAMIPLALWLLKRSPVGARFGATAAPGLLRQLAALPLSASQRIVAIEVGTGEQRRWLVLGVTPQSITTLHSLAPEADAPAPTVPALPSFQSLFAQMRRGGDARSDGAP